MWHDAGRWQSFGTSPSLAWLLACVFANHMILLIVGDHSPWFFVPLQINCCSCCESMRILADRSGSFSIGLAILCGFMLIFADQFAELQRFESLPFPPWQMFKTFLVSMVGQVSIFHWSSSVWRCHLAAACRGGSRSRGCHGYLSALAWTVHASCQHSRHQFPSSSIGDEFNILLINEKFMVPYKSVLLWMAGEALIVTF